MRIVLGINVFIAALLGRESGSARKTVEADLKGVDRIFGGIHPMLPMDQNLFQVEAQFKG